MSRAPLSPPLPRRLGRALCLSVGAALLAATALTASACCPRHTLKPISTAPPPAPAPAAAAPAPAPRVDRSKLPAPGPAKRWAPPGVATWTLPNGMTVWYLRQTQAPLVSLRLLLPHGAASDPRGKAGTTSLMADMLDEGAGGRSALALGEAFQRLATDYDVSVSTDDVTLALDMLADKLEPSLALLADVARRPTFPKAEFQRVKAQALAAALARQASARAVRGVLVRRAVFGDGYAGHTVSGDAGTLKTITLRDVERQYKALVAPAGAIVVVVGDVDRARVRRALASAFGDWAGAPAVKTAALAPPPKERAIYLVDFPGASQSQLAVARRAPGYDDPARFAGALFDYVLAGAFTSRVNLNLREDKGYTYGARGMFLRYRHGGMYVIGAGVKTATTLASLQEIFKELRAMTGARPITAKEFHEAQSGLLLGFPGRFETLAGVAGEVAEVAAEGLGSDWLTRWPAQVATVTRAQANAVAHGVAQADDYAVIVAGDRAKIEGDLKKLGLPIYVYDAAGHRLGE